MPTTTRDIENFIDLYLKELHENNAAVFAGAGLSAAAGYVDWRGLMRPLAVELGLNVDEEHDLIGLAQFHLNENGRHRINQQLLNEIATSKAPTLNHEILARLPVGVYWTTNYDKLIEKALESANKIPDVKYTKNHLTVTKPGRNAVVYKMHGDIDHPDTAVITRDDYERYILDRGAYMTILAGDLVAKTFLFLGFSFTDPNLDYIMSRIRIHFKEHQRQHYCVFKRCIRDEFADEHSYSQAQIRQSLTIKDLSRIQVKTLLVDSYSEITDILGRIERLYRRKTVFVSGSAHDFTPWNRPDVEAFLCKLGSILIEQNYRLSSGIGLGIGNALITGAISAVYNHHNGQIDNHLVMRPFPQGIVDPVERKRTWTKYRREVIGKAGIALFFMGNKVSDDGITLADGVREEFQIAHSLGLAVIPIGASGHMAAELWQELMGDLGTYYDEPSADLIDVLTALGNPVEHPDQLLASIMNAINLIAKE